MARGGTMIGRVLLWMFVVNLGVAFGAGLYEHRDDDWSDERRGHAGVRRNRRALGGLNYLRHAFVLGAWLMALQALSLLNRTRG
jgi:hypothetical protein